MREPLSPAEHRRQIEAYRAEFPHYQVYAAALERVLKEACRISLPLAIVQARPKSLSSFAEKAIRKREKYPDAARDITDLCAARVIVHTTDEANAVRRFIEANFHVLEGEDVRGRLTEREFGYLSLHFVVQLKPGVPAGLAEEERQQIGGRRAEIQVRTLLQHAWADILHDRIYKREIDIPSELVRTGHLLAAITEQGDKLFADMAEEIDTIFGNYAVYLNRAQLQAEIRTQQAILENEPCAENKPAAALRLARLLAAEGRDYTQVVHLLQPYSRIWSPLRFALLLELGHALCRVHRAEAEGRDYQLGQEYLREVVRECGCEQTGAVADPRKERALCARALSLLAWSDEAQPHSLVRVRQRHQQALASEPDNPYHLANVLSFEVRRSLAEDRFKPLGPVIASALDTCRRHATARLELPNAWFTRARLHLLLGQNDEAFGATARGIQHCLDPEAFAPAESLTDEIEFIYRINPDQDPPESHRHLLRLIELAQMIRQRPKPAEDSKGPVFTPPVIVIAGGAGSFPAQEADFAQRLLRLVLDGFQGTAIAGGTNSGIPGCVGKVAAELQAEGRKRFRLLAYLPNTLPTATRKSVGYDEFIETAGPDFGPEELLLCADHLLRSGIDLRSLRVLGLGGGRISLFEYQLSLALGATLAVLPSTGGSAHRLATDPDWCASKNLLLLPRDPMTVRAFVQPDGSQLSEEQLDSLGRRVHESYVADNTSTPDPSMLPWDSLSDDLKSSNKAQAAYAAVILRSVGYAFAAQAKPGEAVTEFTPEEVELMAELEHGRWNIERLQEGWRHHSHKDVAGRHSPSLVGWDDLPQERRDYDRKAIRDWPRIFAQAGLRITRLPDAPALLSRTRELLAQTKRAATARRACA